MRRPNRERGRKFKILNAFDSVKFAENLHRIHVDFGQKHRVNANISFKPIC